VAALNHAPGTFCWAGLAASDVTAAAAFYCGLFGWTVSDDGIFRHDGQEVAILYRQTPTRWTSFLVVEDAEATAARADELGGAAVARAVDMPASGRVAAIRDPTGAQLALWQPAGRTGAARLDCAGALCWNELVTADLGRAKAFFSLLVGWEYERENAHTRVIGANASMRERAGAPPRWIPYFGVRRAGETVRRAEELGGRILAPALIADPLGAAFAVVERK
jgi:predicted enzyme related to lactoylglutathione lyase